MATRQRVFVWVGVGVDAGAFAAWWCECGLGCDWAIDVCMVQRLDGRGIRHTTVHLYSLLAVARRVENAPEVVAAGGDGLDVLNVTCHACSCEFAGLATAQNRSNRSSEPSWIGSAHAANANNAANKPFEFHLRFAGQYEDAETGWHYNWHRFYNSDTGRYFTPDPIGLRGGDNAFGYAGGGDPLRAVDPGGLQALVRQLRAHVMVPSRRFWLIYWDTASPDSKAQLNA